MEAKINSRINWIIVYLVGQVEQTLRHLLSSALEITHQMRTKLLVLCGQKSVGGSLLAGSSRTTDAVSVRVNVPRDVVVDHGLDGRYVQTTS